MMVALAMVAVLSLSSASNARLPPNAHFALDAEREHVPVAGDSLASLVGELDGESISGASIERVLATLEERLNRISCKPADPDDTQSQPREVTCNVPDAERIFPYYADLRQAETPAEHDRHGRRFLDAYATLLKDAADVVITRPSEDEAVDGLLHVLFPFEAWDVRLDMPRPDVHFPFVPVCNLVADRAARCPGADQLRRKIEQAGDESEQRLFCLKEFSRRRLAEKGECPEMAATGP
ncbi:Secreted protein [Stenotrophomonas maltophilia]